MKTSETQEPLSQRLFWAISLSNYKNVEKLLAMGADPNAVIDQYGNTPLHLCVNQIDYTATKILLNAGANVNLTDKEGSTPLHLACEFPVGITMVKIISLLIENGPNLEAKDSKGHTALHKVVESSSKFTRIGPESAKILLNAGANPFNAFHSAQMLMEYFDDDLSWWDDIPEVFKRVVKVKNIFGK